MRSDRGVRSVQLGVHHVMSDVMSDWGCIIVKIGGSTLGEGDSTIDDVVELWRRGMRPVVVHGGGKTISEWVSKQGVRSQFVRGLRVTDSATLEVAVAVLTGLVNSNLVAEVTRAGGPAVSVSGVSEGMFSAVVQDSELGYVGRIESVNPAPVQLIVDAGRIPVVGPAALNLEATSLEDQILNINADTAAGHLACALKADAMIFQTDVEGVLDMRGRVIPQMTKRQCVELINSGVAGGGMIPKLEACIVALEGVKSAHIIDGRVSGALVRCAEGISVGTRIV